MSSKLRSDTHKTTEQVSAYPYGTVTFLFTDIEGSTVLWERMPDAMREAVAQHRAILRQAVEANHGFEFQTFGDSFQAAFSKAVEGLHAALTAQRALRDAAWGPTGPLKVRMGLHTGPAMIDPSGDAPYATSHTLNRASRVMSAGYGGQILLSHETTELAEGELPPGVSLRNLGDHHLRGMTHPERLYQAVVADLPREFPALGARISHPNNLPAQLTSFIGREIEISEVCQRLRQHRLVTLVGAGGTGKTRLALRIAEDVLEDFAEGAWFIELAPVADPQLVDQTIASTLGLQKTTESSYQAILEGYLQEKRILLILDNCEHLLEACARLAHHLIQHCPYLTLLATSREALGITGELDYYVPSLAAPEPSAGLSPERLAQAESIRLFAERAAAVQSGFELSVDTLNAAARICHRLDGIPLAIELAAARVNVLSIEQIAARLDDRFRLLTSGGRTELPRHRTLRASIDWSYNLLPDPQRLLLQRLSVFAGGWTLPAAEAVCSGDGLEEWEILDGLTGLVQKSLVVADRQTAPATSSGAETRFHMLETIRQYAQERMSQSSQAELYRGRHLAFFRSLAEDYEPRLRTPEIFGLLERLDIELDNIRAALTWALAKNDRGGAEQALRILCALFYFWLVRALIFEADGWMQRAIKVLPNDDPPAAALKGWGYLILALQKIQSSHFVRETIDHLNQGIALLRQVEYIPLGRLKLALALATRKAAILQFLTFYPAEPPIQAEVAQADSEESLALASEYLDAADAGSRWLVSWIYLFHARTEFTGKGHEQIFPLTQVAQDISMQLGDQVVELLVLRTVVWLYLPDHPEQCAANAKQGISLARRLGDKSVSSTVNFNATLGLSAYMTGEFYDMENYFYEIDQAFRHTAVSGTVWGETWNVRTRGIAAVNQGDAAKAYSLLSKALSLAQANTDPYGILAALLYFAGVALIQAKSQEAAMLLGFIERQFEGFFKEMDPLPDRMEFEKYTDRLRQVLSEVEFDAAWAEGRSMDLDQAVRQAFSLCPTN